MGKKKSIIDKIKSDVTSILTKYTIIIMKDPCVIPGLTKESGKDNKK